MADAAEVPLKLAMRLETRRALAALIVVMLLRDIAAQSALHTPALDDSECGENGCAPRSFRNGNDNVEDQMAGGKNQARSGHNGNGAAVDDNDGGNNEGGRNNNNEEEDGRARERDRMAYPGKFRGVEAVPPTPDEFQKFVATSIGSRLPVYGRSLFERIPATFAPVDRVPVTGDYEVGPGDEILIRAWGQIDLNGRLVVDRDGQVFLPKVGTLSVAGLKYQQLPEYFRSSIGRVFRNFDLTISLGQLRSIQIFVAGRARRPGSYTVSSLCTLVNALFASGGPAESGSMRRIELRRNDAVVTEFDLYDLLLRGDKSKDAKLLPGDVIYIPAIGPSIAIAGSVNAPAIYELRGGVTLAQAIDMAGGLSTTADGRKATVERIENHTTRRVEEFLLDEPASKAVSAATGSETAASREAMSGAASSNRPSLKEPALQRSKLEASKFEANNLEANLGQAVHPPALERVLKDGDVVRVLAVSPRFENVVTLRGNVAHPGRIAWRQGMRLRDVIPNQESLITRDYWRATNWVASAGERGDWQSNQDYWRATSSRATADERDHPQRENAAPERDLSGAYIPTADAGAEDGQPPVKKSSAAATRRLRNEIARNAPEINWDYAVIQRLNPEDLTTRLLPFDLGKLVLQGDEQNNLALEAGDVITIFSQNDLAVPLAKQSKYVRLEGEFRTAGVYQAEPGETVRHLVARAGGFTPNAYLFGAAFTRESVRADQQKGLDQLVEKLEEGISHNALAPSGLNADDIAGQRAKLEAQRQMVERLREVKASGRVVLDLDSHSSSVVDLPEIALEDGDRFVVP
jgi:protein involved in polysaccharide export with SLBB domain